MNSQQLYEMIRVDIRKTIGQYLSGLMDAELSHFLGRKPYERIQGETNHRNGSYDRNFMLKGISDYYLNKYKDTKLLLEKANAYLPGLADNILNRM